ncbi:hypothetical protein HK105_207427 [Polyrhizophydium stewartii]|uniref:RZZ complex subunit KNTC1/ROD C-terminal domain-containing protein n=1 Tax=Polyrhizophydium stewartii TaxID=2732419 RepID=A0ABR4N0P3_9FUNG
MAGRRLELVAHAHIEAPRPPPDGPPGTGAAAVHHGRAEHVTAARAGALLCVAAGSELHIIASDKRLAGQVELDCPIEALAVHPALPLAVVGDSLGSIHLVHLPLSEVFYSQMVVPQALLSAAASHGRIFACVTFAASGSSTELVVASTVGSLLRLSNIDFELVNAMVSEGDTEDAAAEIRDQVKVEAVSLLPASTEQLRHLHITHDLIYACASGDSPLSRWARTPETDKTTCIDTFLAVLDERDQLTLLDAASMIALSRIHAADVVDIWFAKSPLSVEADQDENAMALFLLRRSQHECELVLLSVPHLGPIYEQTLEPCSYLISSPALQSSRSVCEFAVVQQALETTSIRVVELVVASALQSARTLIAAGRLDEAEELAVANQIDIQSMYKMRIEALMHELDDTPVLPQIMGDIEAIMTRIKDAFFVVNHCTMAKTRSAEHARKLLDFARQRLEAELASSVGPSGVSLSQSSGHPSRLSPLAQTVDSASKRLATFMHLHAQDDSQWPAFAHTPNAELIKEALATGESARALNLWRRHATDPALRDNIPSILAEIGEGTSIQDTLLLVHELEEYIPTVEQRFLVDRWIMDRARLLEATDGAPHGALRLVESIERFYSRTRTPRAAATSCTPAKYVELLVHQTQFSLADPAHPIRAEALELLAHLRDLVSLWDKHDMKISLQAYEAESPASIAMSLIDRVAAPELLPSTVENHVKPYIMRHEELSLPVLLSEYCQTVMDTAVGSGKQISYESWEPRVLAVVPLVRDSNLESDIILEMMRRTSIPWSAELDVQIRKCLDDATTNSHKDIVEQFRLMQLKVMMLHYGIASFNIGNMGLAKRLLRHILSQRDKRHALEDALQVVKAYHHLRKMDVYVMRAQILLTGRLLDRCRLLLATGSEMREQDPAPPYTFEPAPGSDAASEIQAQLTRAERTMLCQQLLVWVVLQIKHGIANGNETLFVSMVEAGKTLCSIIGEFSIQSTHLPPAVVFQRLARLHNDFGQMVHPDTLMDPVRVRELLETKIRQQPLGALSAEVFSDIYRFADALGMPRDAALRRLVRLVAATGDLELLLVLCSELVDCSPGAATAQTLAVCCRIALESGFMLAFESNNSNVLKLSGSLLHLARLALQHSDRDDLPRHLDLFKDLELLHHILMHSDMGEYRASLSKRRRLSAGRSRTNSDDYVSAGGSSSAGQSSAGALSRALGGYAAASADSAGEADNSDADETQARFGASVFREHYREAGLVFNTRVVLEHTVGFVLSAIAMGETLAREIHDPFGSSEPVSANKGKRASHKAPGRELAHHHGRQLFDACMHHRHFQLALRVSQRLLELARSPLSDNALGSHEAVELANEYTRLSESAMQHLATQMLSAKTIDKHYALACLLNLPTKTAFEAFKSGMATTGRDFGRLERIAKVGAMAGLIWSQHDFQTNCQRLAVHARWWQELQLLDIPFDQARYQASANGEYQRDLVPKLLYKTGGDLEMVLEFTTYYHIEDDHVYFEFAKQQLFSRSPARQSDQDSAPRHHVRIAGILADIDNKNRYLEILATECLPRISPYNYEDIRFVNEQILSIDPNQRSAKTAVLALDLLKTYRRTVQPTHAELAAAFKAFSEKPPTGYEETDTLKKACEHSDKRLPFHMLLSDPWAVLAAEISEESLPKLVPICYILGLSADTLHLRLVDSKIKTLQKELAHGSHEAVATRGIKSSDFRSLLSKIKDNEKAVSTSVLVGGVFPCGVDRIALYRLALQLAERWLSSSKSDLAQADTAAKAETTIVRLKKMIVQVETEHQLRSNRLASFVQFASSPLDLCMHLYKHGAASPAAQTCNIHDVIETIAKRSSIKVEDIQRSLLSEAERVLQNEILFVFERNPQQGAQLLLRFAYQPSNKIETWARVRALTVLLRLSRLSELPSKELSEEDVWQYMRMMMYLKEFQELNIVQSLQEFMHCDKAAFVRSLWLSHRNDAKGLRLICKLSIDYNVLDGELLHSVLVRLVEKGELHFVIESLEILARCAMVSILGWMPYVWAHALTDAVRGWSQGSEPDPLDTSDFHMLLARIAKFPYEPHHLQPLVACLCELAGATSRRRKLLAAIALAHVPRGPETVAALEGMFESLDDKELFWMLDLMHDGDGLNDSADPAVDAGVLAVAGRLLSDCAMAQINHRQIFSTIAASPHVDAFVKYFAWHDLEVVAEVSRAEHEGGDESGDARVRMLRAYVAKHGLGAAGEAAVERAAAALGSAAGGEGRADARGGDAE